MTRSHHRCLRTVRGRILAGAAGLLLAFAGALPPILSGQADPADPAIFSDRVEVELINLQVWVTDRKGRPAEGLEAGDFELEVDGEPVSITHFSEVRGDRAVDVPAARAEAAPAPAAPEAPSRLVLYFDETHLSALGRKNALKDLRELLGRDEALSGNLLVLRQASTLVTEASFDSPPEIVSRALERLEKPSPHLTRAPVEKQVTVDRLWQLCEISRQRTDRDPCQFFPRSAMPEVTTYARQAFARTLGTGQLLTDVARFLGGIPGAKTVLYVGDQLDLSPGEDLIQIVRELCPFSEDRDSFRLDSEDLSERFDRLARQANANRVTIYTLQAKGLEVGVASSAGQQATRGQAMVSFDRALRHGDQSGLGQLALATGGKAFFNSNRFVRQLRSMAHDLENYYSLAFPASELGGAASHRLKVRTRVPGLKARHRRNVRVKEPEERLEERLLSSIYLGRSENELGIRLGYGEVKAVGGNRFKVPLHVFVPAGELTFLPTAQGDRASLEVMVTWRSPNHDDEAPTKRHFRLERPREPEDRIGLPVSLELATGLYTLGVGVVDVASGTSASVSTSITVSASPPGSGAR